MRIIDLSSNFRARTPVQPALAALRIAPEIMALAGMLRIEAMAYRDGRESVMTEADWREIAGRLAAC